MLGLVQTFLGEWLTVGLAIVALVAAAAAYFRLPIFGKEAALVLVALAVGLLAWRAGYVTRAAQDQSAALRARIETLERDKAIADRSATDARTRAASLETQAAADQDRISRYERFLEQQDRLPIPAPEPALAPAGAGMASAPVRPADACRLSPDDLRMLVGGAGPVGRAKPAAAP